jgi:hypothetical protein
MPYNLRQYDSARDFIGRAGTSIYTNNVVATNDKIRCEVYDLFENIYNNSTYQLKVTLRGDESHAILMPTGEKIVEAINRFLGINLDYLVEAQGDSGTQQALDDWFKTFFAREKLKSKFESSKRWGLVRGDAALYIYAKPNKAAGERLCVIEVDPRQIMEIEDPDDPTNLLGYHIVEIVQDFREPDNTAKQISKRRTFRKVIDENTGEVTGITTELSYWENAKWDDRVLAPADLEPVAGGPNAEPPTLLPDPITDLPIYKWRSKPPQNSSWGVSALAGLETVMYAVNQSLTDEDATMVFQGLGMYVTSAAPPIDQQTGQITDWNIGPQQIIEIGTDQKFDRVSGVNDLKPFQDHITALDDGGSECKGVPQVAIGKVDVNAVQSGIALKMELMPLMAANAEKELELINVLDQMFHDIVTQWLPAYEDETFGNAAVMSQCSVVCVFDDPMPVDRDAKIQETLLLQTSNLILTEMAVAQLRELGWKYPTTDPSTGKPLSDKDIADMLNEQASAAAQAVDPFAAQASNMSAFDQASGTPPPAGNLGNTIPNNGQGNAPPTSRQILLPSQ